MSLVRSSRRLTNLDSEGEALDPGRKRQASPPRRETSEVSTFSTEILDDDLANITETAKQVIRIYSSTGKEDEKLGVCLDAFLDHLPEASARAVANDIIRCEDDHQKLFEVFEDLRTSLLIPSKLDYFLITSVDLNVMTDLKTSDDNVSDNLCHRVPFLKHHDQAEAVARKLPSPLQKAQRFREYCFKRDGYRCLVTGIMDREHYKKSGKGDEGLKEKGISAVEEAHIIPFSYASYDSSDVSLVGSNILHNIEAIPEVTFERWSILYRCFPIVREIGMTVSKINDVANGLSLHPTVRSEFGEFRMAFQATDEPHTYQIKTYRYSDAILQFILPKDRIVRFKNNSEDANLALPNPELIRTHHAIAEIMNACGFANDISGSEEILRVGSLSEDGSTDVGRLVRTGLTAS